MQKTVYVREKESELQEVFEPIIKDRDARERVTLMLEGQMEMEGVEGRIAQWLRLNFYDPLFEEFGIDAERYLNNYSPRLRMAEDVLRELEMEDLPDEIRFFAEHIRTGELHPRETDALELAQDYLRMGAKRKFIEPIREQLEPVKQQMPTSMERYYDGFVDDILGRPGGTEEKLNRMFKDMLDPLYRRLGWGELTGRPAQQAATFLTQNVYLSTMGFNASTAIKNLGQQALVVGHLSEDYPGQGLKYWTWAQKARLTEEGRELLRYNWVRQNRVYLEGLDLRYRIQERIMGPVRDKAMGMFRKADQYNVDIAFLAGYRRAIDQNMSLEEAIEKGNQTAMSTQFMYGMDSPQFFRTPIGRLIGQFKTWPINFMELMYEEATSAQRHRIVSNVVSLVVGYTILENLTGLSFQTAMPQETIKRWLPVDWLLGEGGDTPSTEAISSWLNLAQAFLEEDDPQLLEEATETFIRRTRYLFPDPTIQWDRTADFIRTAVNDWKVYDQDGRYRHSVEPGEAVRRLFGTTVEQVDEWERHQDIERRSSDIQRLRKEAVKAIIDEGDITSYQDITQEIIRLGGNPIREADIKRELRYRGVPAIERHMQQLPPAAKFMLRREWEE